MDFQDIEVLDISVKSTVKISSIFVAFLENTNFTTVMDYVRQNEMQAHAYSISFQPANFSHFNF